MEAMKEDLATLVKQLNENEEKYRQLSKYQDLLQNEMNEKNKPNINKTPTKTSLENIEPDMTPLIKIRQLKSKNLELQKMVSSRDAKVKEYQKILINLKEEFIKSEEDKAILELNTKAAAESRPVMDPYEIDQLKSQVLPINYFP